MARFRDRLSGRRLDSRDIDRIKRRHLRWMENRAEGERASLRDVNLQGANLRGSDLEGWDLRDALLQGTDLRGASLKGADLTDAILQGADLRGADLRNASLKDAILQGADLRDADLRGADLDGAIMQQARLKGARLDRSAGQGPEFSGPTHGPEANEYGLRSESLKGTHTMNYGPPPLPRKRGFYRSADNMLLGVCAGIAYYFDFAPWGVRLFFLILQFSVAPYMFLVYAGLALIMKKPPRPVQFRNYEDEDFYYAYQSSRSDALRKAKNAFDVLDKRLQRMEDVVTDRNFELEQEYKKL